MSLSPEQEALRDRFLQSLVEAAVPLQQGPDREAALEALIEAAELLRHRLETELVEYRAGKVE